ncbi:BCCT family transporter [Gemmobacter denitrificans]|uniref:BCCT family transporter n=1 Tax=Gemmobacter denitrificans TaxID=3123040 RepID=A0ABU8BRB0_9RHOB
MTFIISAAYVTVLVAALFVVLRWADVPCTGPTPVNTFTLVALLFTAGLDMGLVMLPLTEFPVYAGDAAYGFTNPLAVEFGMWGPMVWLMYFLATFYFVVLEPRLKVFDHPAVKWVYNLTIIATCAFTGYLFLTALPAYAPGLPNWAVWALVIGALAVSVYSSGNLHFMKWLAILSTWGFGILVFTALVIVAFVVSGIGVSGLLASIGKLGGYFANLHRFATPITDYHEFYLFWWFSWSIMIGQFVANFVGGLKSWKLAIAMVALPALPLGLWFAVLFLYFEHQLTIPGWLNWAMITVGIVFVVNSLDSLIRLYSANLGWGVGELGWPRYFPLHFGLQFALVLAYQFTPFKIEWVGLVVIGLYSVVFVTMAWRHAHVRAAVRNLRAEAR